VSGSLQLGFSDYEQVYAKKKTRRQIFLEEMEATIPWDDFHALIRPVYHQPSWLPDTTTRPVATERVSPDWVGR
jgi:hypothetical protein